MGAAHCQQRPCRELHKRLGECVEDVTAVQEALVTLGAEDISDMKLLDSELKESKVVLNFLLLKGAKDGDVECVKSVIGQRADPDCRQPFAQPVVPQSLELNASKTAFRAHGLTPLMYAAQSGSVELCELLLLNGARPNATEDEGRTALHFAASAASKGACTVLLRRGAKPDQVDDEGRRPLDMVPLEKSRSDDDRERWVTLMYTTTALESPRTPCAVLHDRSLQSWYEHGGGFYDDNGSLDGHGSRADTLTV